VPQSAARLIGFVALGAIGALEWQRLVGGLASGRALLWVVAALAAALLVLATSRLRDGWPSGFALPWAALGGLLLGYVVSGAPLHYLKPRHWDELVTGMVNGLQALGTVKIPYRSADPWPATALQVVGAELLVLAAVMTFWPRVQGRNPDQAELRAPWARTPAAPPPPARRRPPPPPRRFVPPERGYPFLALAVLLVVIVSPIVSLGGRTSLLLGLAIAGLTVCFLWLERVPLRPGLGIAALVAVALVGALPLAAVADRDEAWFDYRAFAEGLGPDDPVRFDWSQSYGPIDWPRDGNEVLRVQSSEPLYWKARDLDGFDGASWTVRTDPTPVQRNGDASWEADLPEDFNDRPAWTSTIEVSVRRMRSTTVVGAGTIMKIDDASRDVRPGLASGTWDAPSGLRRGDSYTAEVHAPDPTAVELTQASAIGPSSERALRIPLLPGKKLPGGRIDDRVRAGLAHFPPYGALGTPSVEFPGAYQAENYDIDAVMRRSYYAATWDLAKRLKRGTKTPYDYILNVDRYLHRSSFRYSERPPATPAGRAPLDYFLTTSEEGYCQHFAGGMALLLRMGGVPARVATGFSPGGYSARRKAWIVRDTDAHAWVEAWFDRYGWVTLDPTPDATPARSQIAALTPPVTAAPLAPDRATPGPGDDGAAADNGPIRVRPDLLLENQSGDSGAGATTDGVPDWIWGVGIAGLLAALVVSLALLRRPRGAVAELEDALRRLGRPISTGTTLHQLERRIGGHSPEAAGYLHALTAGRYAPAPPSPTRAGRRALRRALAQGLGPTGRLRALWALPPRFRHR
jgi:transglutaminase-like putative cysteine protease